MKISDPIPDPHSRRRVPETIVYVKSDSGGIVQIFRFYYEKDAWDFVNREREGANQ